MGSITTIDPRLLSLRRLPRASLGAGAWTVVRYVERHGQHCTVYRDRAGASLFVPHHGARPTLSELRAALA
jgi:hypothetical protein